MKAIATFRTIHENLSNKNRAWLVVGALSKLQNYTNGTPYEPVEEASKNYHKYVGRDTGIGLMEQILKHGVCTHYTGDIIVDLGESHLLVCWSERAIKEYGIEEKYIGDLANQEIEVE